MRGGEAKRDPVERLAVPCMSLGKMENESLCVEAGNGGGVWFALASAQMLVRCC